jgi:hypothetical protein
MERAFAVWIGNNVPALTLGTNWFAGPDKSGEPDTAGFIMQSSPGAANFYSPDMQTVSVQIIFRARNYFVAKDLAQGVFDFLQGKSGYDIGNPVSGQPKIRVNTIEAQGLPYNLGPDEKMRSMVTMNFIFRVQNQP